MIHISSLTFLFCLLVKVVKKLFLKLIEVFMLFTKAEFAFVYLIHVCAIVRGEMFDVCEVSILTSCVV